MDLTIQSAADAWLHALETRKRRPAKPATLSTLRSIVRAHVSPRLGDQEIATFGGFLVGLGLGVWRIAR
jgi:hypothetical protein